MKLPPHGPAQYRHLPQRAVSSGLSAYFTRTCAHALTGTRPPRAAPIRPHLSCFGSQARTPLVNGTTPSYSQQAEAIDEPTADTKTPRVEALSSFLYP